MDIEKTWEKIKNHRVRLNDNEIHGLAVVLFRGREEWLAEKLRQREDMAMAIEFLSFLGKEGSDQAAQALLNTLESGDEALQAAAAEALKQCPFELIVERLISLMLARKQAAAKAGEIILRFTDAGADVLWRLWFGEEKPASLKALIIELLAEVSDPRVELLAYLALLSDNDELIEAALRAAEKIDAKALWGNVLNCLFMANWKHRGMAVRLLGKWKERRALNYLYEMGADPDPWVEEERQRAIGSIII